MQSRATTPRAYLAELPDDRREAIAELRKVIRKNLPEGFKEGMQYGMIGYFVPHSVFPEGYHCDPSQPLPFASLASQKNHMALYSHFLYQDPAELDRFVKAWKATGKKLDMGKSCVRFRKLADVPLDVIGEAIARQDVRTFVDRYKAQIGHRGKGRPKKR